MYFVFYDKINELSLTLQPYNLNGNKEERKRSAEEENIEDRDNDDLYDTLPADSVRFLISHIYYNSRLTHLCKIYLS